MSVDRRIFFDDHPDPMWIYDRETLRFLEVNTAAVEAYGYDRATFLTMDLTDIRPAEDVAAMREHAHSLAGGTTSGSIWRHRVRSGQIIDVAITSQPTEYDDRPARLVIARNVTRQLEAERRLAALEQGDHGGTPTFDPQRLYLLEAAVARMNDILVITEAEPLDEPGPRIVFANAAFERKTGYRLEEVIGRSPRFLEGPESDPAELRRIGAARRALKPIRTEIVNYTKAGEPLWLELDIAPISDPAGVLTHWVAIERDVSDRKRAEQRLLDVIEGASVGTWEWSHITGEQEINERWAQMLGYSKSDFGEFRYDRWRNLLHPDDLVAAEALIERCITSAEDTFAIEYRMRHRDGHWVWMMDRGRVIRRSATGKVEFMAGVMIDISERKEREMALAQAKSDLERVSQSHAAAEQRFHDIAAISEDWFWEQDSAMRFTFLSKGSPHEPQDNPVVSMLGLTLEEWLAANPVVRSSANWDWLLAEVRARRTFRDFLFRAPNLTEGGDRWLRLIGAPFHSASGVFIGYRGVVSNVTQLYIAKERAEEASHTKSLFLANMSHELRTPLNGVLGMAEMLDASLTNPRQKALMKTIRESGELLLTILNDILDMSKIEAGKLELEAMPFRPQDIAAQVEDLHALRAQEKGLSFDVMTGAGADVLRLGDPLRIRLITQNLVSNAIKFTEKGEVTVTISGRRGRPLVIEVADSGIGMSADQITRIYDEFSQADNSITRRYGGTGLGMAITRRLVDMMGGEIEIRSRPGEGTQVRVSLPLPEADPAPERLAAPSGTARLPLEGLRVLVADDNATNCTVLDMMLTRAGAKVTLVRDGVAAVAAWADGAQDIVLLDIAMPVMDGLTALRQIRQREAADSLRRTPMLAVTANAMLHQVAEYMDAGFDAHLPKPVRLADLTATILRLVPR